LILYELVVGEPAFDPSMKSGDILKQAVSGDRPKLPASMNAILKEVPDVQLWRSEGTKHWLFSNA
jgi:hypothetical protein